MKYFTLLCSIFIMSCASQKNIVSNYNSEGFDITSLKGSSVRLCINPIVDAGMFARSFDDEYKSNGRFWNILADKLKDKLEGFSTLSVEMSGPLASLITNQSPQDNTDPHVKALFNQTKENYVIAIKRVIVSRNANQESRTDFSNTDAAPSRGRPAPKSNAPQRTSMDACVMKLVAEVWSVKDQKKVAAFTAMGQSKVILMAIGHALNDALDNSVSNFADYVKEKQE
jgi:hypothetical protein